MASYPSLQPAPKIFIFGSQQLSFDIRSFNSLRTQLLDARNRWALEAVSSLSGVWKTVLEDVPKLQHLNGGQLLEDLATGLTTGEIPPSHFPLPNILLSPLVVISHLTQYSAFLRTALPDLDDASELPAPLTESTEVLGLCTGLLSALAAGCSSSLVQLQHFGPVAVRLAMLVGALVDAEEASPGSDGKSISLSVSWSGSDSSTNMKQVLERFPEAYESVCVDEKRSTVTVSKRKAPALVQQFKAAGVHVSDVALSGRFHWQKHQEDVEKIIHICDKTQHFQFLDASKMAFSSRLETGGEYLSTGSLHEMALRDILLKQSDWVKTFKAICSSHLTTDDAKVICFGQEHCVPPTIARKLGSHLLHVSDINLATSPLPRELLGRNPAASLTDLPDDRIAVVGMSCNVPGGEDLEEFWNMLASGQSQHTEVTSDRIDIETEWRKSDSNRKWYGNFIHNYDTFDNKFFKKSPREMASADPQQRLIWQLAYQAIEQSGYFSAPSLDRHIGCYVGVGNNDYDRNIACHPANAYSATGNLKSFIAGKVSHHFGWTGPSLTIDTACSSSSVAVHQACRAIINGECTSAVAGGVNVLTGADWFHNMAGASFLSPTGQCKPFDVKGDGYCRAEGAGLVYLKKLSSAIASGDQVLGVIASTRVYQNQNCTAITVPNAISLSELFADVTKQARLEPRAVSVVEAHGTGTAVGDPAEYDGIRRVFGGSIRSEKLHLSSVKGSVGHAEFASGIISLLKILLMINKGLIPPQASFTSISPLIGAKPEDRIEIPTRLKPWDVGFRAALINNYGASGSNSSMVITQAPKHRSPSPSSALASAKAFPFWFCGFEENSLRTYSAKFRRFLQHHSDASKDLSVGNLSFQLFRQSNRSLPQGLIFSASSANELEQKLAAFEKGDKSVATIQRQAARPLVLCFGGQISTYVGLDKDLYDHTTILKSHLDQCDAICLSFGLESIYPHIFQRSPVEDIVKLQTMLFATQYACAKAWIDSGVKVAAVVGHSFGELTALCVAGAYSLRDAFKLIAGRARLIQDKWGADRGSMLAVEADLTDVDSLLSKSRALSSGESNVSIACYNGPRSFTLAGSTKAVDSLQDLAKSDPGFSSLKLKRLNVTNAFHSALVNPLTNGLEALGRDIVFNEPTIAVERAMEHDTNNKLDSSFAATHMRDPVYFNHAVQRLAKKYPDAIWLEAGSNSTITNIASRALGNLRSAHFQPINVTSNDSSKFLVDATTKLWKEGLDVSFWAHHASQISDYMPLLLPPYQFEKTRNWMELKKPSIPEARAVERVVSAEVPKRLTTFIGYQDKEKRSARFQVNTSVEKFQRPFQANVMVSTAAVAPGMLQLQVVLDALTNIRPDFKDFGFQPELRGMSFYNALTADSFQDVFLDAIFTDDGGLVWDWKLSATNSAGVAIDCTAGMIVFRPASDSQLKDNHESLTRLSGRKRCISLLEGNHADEVLQSRNIYRAFEQVVDYKGPYRHVTKIAAKDNESAGRVIKTYDGEAWIDPILTECFCQVAGVYLNLMTDTLDLSERGIFVCDRIDRWVRNPKLGSDASFPKFWEVFAVHHQESETRYISDVFAFDSRDGSLVEAVLGMSYQKVSIDVTRKALSSATQSELPSTTNTVTQVSVPVPAPQPLMTASVPTPPPSPKSVEEKVKKAPKSSGPTTSTKTREIVCNLSGLEPEEIKDDSDLVELGIDSLMGMEIAREVEAAFKITLSNEQLLALTDFHSLVSCIRSTAGLEDGEDSNTAAQSSLKDETEQKPTMNGSVTHINGVNGVNGAIKTNGTSEVNGFHKVNGVHEVNGIDEVDGVNQVNGIAKVNGVTEVNGMNGVNGIHEVSGMNGHLSPSAEEAVLHASTVLDVFREIKWATDDFVVKGQLGSYYKKVMPRSTEICIVFIVDALEQLGCPIRSATPGQRLERVQYLPKHGRLMDFAYELLEKDARLIDIHGSAITRTAVAPPAKSAEALLGELLRDEPAHAAEHKLTALIGPNFADCLVGKEDGLSLMFGTPEGREIFTDVYGNTPFTGAWVQQLEYYLTQLLGKLPNDRQPLCILEMGTGTGGTATKLVPMLARLGVPVKYTLTDIAPSLVAVARKRFKQYPFVEFKVLDIEAQPDAEFLQSQHIVLATNCVHSTQDLSNSLTNIHRVLRPDGFLMLLEMTAQVPWVHFTLGLVEEWWLSETDKNFALSPATQWEQKLHSVGFGHVDWTEGDLPEASLQRLIIAHASGPRYDRGVKPPSPPAPAPATSTEAELAERQAAVDAAIHKYTKDFHAPSQHITTPTSPSPSGRCVLVTGATGSLGSHIVANLVQLPEVHTVVCLNRISTVEATLRQKQSLEMRGISLDSATLAKLHVVETTTSKAMLGLSPETYSHLINNVTDIVHSAWPMSLTRAFRAYESQLKVFRNLIDLAREVAEHRPAPFKFGFQFISSIAVVGNYFFWTGKALVPEQPTVIESVPATGYADAKLACEHILRQTLHRYPDRFDSMAVRIAQISGSRNNGYWNPTEYMPFLIKSSQVLKVLPDLDGTLSWYPSDAVAETLGDLLMSKRPSDLIYHIDNPSRQTWKDMIATLARGLDLPMTSIVPYDQWCDRVRRFRATVNDNPALQLMDYWDYYFVPMSCGDLILDTTKTSEHSETLRTIGPIDDDIMMKYVTSWKDSGFLNP